MKDELKCPICGNPTYIYFGNPRKDRLCQKHGKELHDGLIEQCPDCGKWHETGKNCDCKQQKNPDKQQNTEITCLICGQPSNEKHFCYDCWKKYKDKVVDIRIMNCKDVKILDNYGNLTIECDDGRRVRSRAEALISNFFYNNKIRSVYEKTIYYQENGETKTVHPDFYLPDYDLYIEYNEIKKKSYLQNKEYTKNIYNKLNMKVVIMNDEDLNSIAGFLKPILHIN